MEKYKVLKECVITCEDGPMTFAEGAEFDPTADKFTGTPEELAALLSDGAIEFIVSEETPGAENVAAATEEEETDEEDADEEVEEETAAEEVEKPKVYMGKEVISESTREVEGKFYHALRLSDGSSCDLNDEQYAEAFDNKE